MLSPLFNSHQSVKNTILGDIPFNNNSIPPWPQRPADKLFGVYFPLVAALAKADVMFHLCLNPA